MEEVIYRIGQRIGNPFDRFQILQAGARHRLGGTEMCQKGAFARLSDARNIIQRRCTDGFGPLGAVGTNGKTVRLVPEALDEIEHRIVMPERHRSLAGAVEFFLAGIAILALGDTDEGHIRDAEFGKDFRHRRNLPGTTINQQQVGPVAIAAIRIFFQQAFETGADNLIGLPSS